MGIFGSLDISASALSAERLRMDVTAENLANAQSTRTANGGPYRRKEVVLQDAGSSSGMSFAASLVKPLNPHCVSRTSPRPTRTLRTRPNACEPRRR